MATGVSVVSQTFTDGGSTFGPAVVDCGAGAIAIGGGARTIQTGNEWISASYPSTSDGTPISAGAPGRYWAIEGWTGESDYTVYAICAADGTP